MKREVQTGDMGRHRVRSKTGPNFEIDRSFKDRSSKWKGVRRLKVEQELEEDR